MIDSLRQGNQTEAQAHYRTAIEAAKDDEEKLEIEVVYLYHLYIRGNTQKMQEFESLAKTKENKHTIYFWMALAYETTKQYGHSAHYYELAANAARSSDDKASSIVQAAEALYSNDEKEKAYLMLEKEVGNQSNPIALSKLYKGLASLYDKEKAHFNRALALEKALEYTPNDSSLLFDAAYAYSNAEESNLAVLHYKDLINLDPQSAYAFNNLGVEYSRLKLPISSIKSYKSSRDKGNTLAASNMAYKLLEAGFDEEANSILEDAAKKSDAHENVAHAKSRLVKDKAEEAENIKEILNIARKVQMFYRSFARAYFSKHQGILVAGKWQFPSYGEFELLQEGNSVNASREQGETKIKLSASISNSALQGYVNSKTGYYSESTEQIKLYLNPDGKTMTMLKGNDIDIVRKVDTPVTIN